MGASRELAELASAYNSGSPFGFKNRIINGGMVIDQRNAGASVSVIDGTYTIDRWAFYSQTALASKGTIQQNAGSVTPPSGYSKYLGFTSSSAYTIGAGEGLGIVQKIEGQNIFDLGWGAAGASTVTLSFWVRSSLTGTFGGSIFNSSANRSYPFNYTISSANTWEQKSITIAGDTSGTWLTTNGIGMYVFLGVGVGSTYSGAAGSWSGSFYLSATGATSVVGTNGATFYITGVQLEKGSTATSFDFRSYGQELALCQRYFEKSYNIDVAVGTVNSAAGLFDGGVTSNAGNVAYTTIYYKAAKRANATVTGYTYSAGTSGSWSYDRNGASSSASTVIFGSNGMTSTGASFNVGAAWAAAEIYGHWTASAEL